MTCDRCAELEERVRQLEAELYHNGWEVPQELGLTHFESRMLAAMVRTGRPCTKEFLIQATRGIPGSKSDYPESNVIASKICHLRRKLRPFGCEIITVWGGAFRIDPISRERLLHWQERAAA